MRCITNSCVSRDACDVVECIDSLSSFQGSVNLHWTSRLDDLKPDGRERSENTVGAFRLLAGRATPDLAVTRDFGHPLGLRPTEQFSHPGGDLLRLGRGVLQI